MGAGILLLPLSVYLVLMTVLCVKVADASSWKVGWFMAAGAVFLPLALFVAFLVA